MTLQGRTRGIFNNADLAVCDKEVLQQKKSRENGDKRNERVWFAPASLNLHPGQHFKGYYDRLPTSFAPGCPWGIQELYIHQIMIRPEHSSLRKFQAKR